MCELFAVHQVFVINYGNNDNTANVIRPLFTCTLTLLIDATFSVYILHHSVCL